MVFRTFNDPPERAELNSTGVLKTTQLPDLSITSIDVVPDQTARLNLDAEEGDVAIQTDISETFILSTNDPTVNNNWKKIQLDITGAIDGQTITPGQLGLSSDRPDIFAEDMNARFTSDDYIYAGEFSGSTPSSRLSNADSAASSGDVIYLENALYNNAVTISTGVSLIGAGAFQGQGTIFETTLTLSSGSNITVSRFRIQGSGKLLVDSFQTVVSQVAARGNGITVNADSCLLFGILRGSVTFASGTAGGIVDASTCTVTDNGSNTIGDLG
jgi:hypothetical protein